MKRIFIFLIAAALLSASFPALAKDAPQLLISENNITEGYIMLEMQVDSDYAGSPVLVRAVDEDRGEDISNLIWAEQTRINSGGRLELKIDISGFDTAKYVFIADVEGMTAPVKTSPSLQIYSSGEKDILWKSVQDAVFNKEASEFEWIVDNRGEYLSLNVTDYNALGTQKTQFLTNLTNCTYTSLDDFVKKFNLNIRLAGFIGANEDAAKTLAESLFEDLGMTSSASVAAYMKSDSLKTAAAKRLISDASMLTADNFRQIFDSAIVLKELSENTGLWTGYESIIKKYQTEIGISMSEYNGLTNQSKVMNSMINSNGSFTTLDMVKEKFNELVAEAGKVSPSVPKNDRYSGGGGGGGGVVKPSQPQTPANIEKSLFKDIETVPWAKEAICCLAERGIINGRGDETFAPDDSITRAETVKLLVTAFNVTAENNKSVFTDVKPEDWFSSYVTAAYYSGIVNGLTQDSFGPDEPVTRQDLCVMIARLIKNDSAGLSDLSFDDNAEISGYAKDAVALLVKQGIINGIGGNRFAPNEKATRAQTAKIVYEMIKTGV